MITLILCLGLTPLQSVFSAGTPESACGHATGIPSADEDQHSLTDPLNHCPSGCETCACIQGSANPVPMEHPLIAPIAYRHILTLSDPNPAPGEAFNTELDRPPTA